MRSTKKTSAGFPALLTSADQRVVRNARRDFCHDWMRTKRGMLSPRERRSRKRKRKGRVVDDDEDK